MTAPRDFDQVQDTSRARTPAFSGPELCRLSAHRVIDLLRAGEISPRDLLDASFARIEMTGAAINATPTLCPDRAYGAAERLGSSAQETPLAGLPISIKDLTAVAGVRTTFGTKGLADFIPHDSDPLVTRLESSGGVVIGKTNTPEFGAGGNTFNDVFGATLNPWDLSLNAGGSSGGAAASLATGEVWLSHGSDHGGSLRTPAAYCGVVGLRPSPGRVAAGGKDAAYLLEGVHGPMARSVRDCALFLDAMAGFDARSPLSFDARATPFRAAAERPNHTLRIGFTPDFGGINPVESEMEAHLRGVLAQLERDGAHVDDITPELDLLDRTYHVLRGTMWATLARRLPREIRQHFKVTLEENTRMGEALTVADICDAHLDRTTIYNAMLTLFDTFDVIACPVVGCMPQPQSEEWVGQVAGQNLSGYMDWLRFAFLATVTGLPAISVPVGLGPRGLPVGLQLIGKPRGEAGLLSSARAVELSVAGPLGPIDPVG